MGQGHGEQRRSCQNIVWIVTLAPDRHAFTRTAEGSEHVLHALQGVLRGLDGVLRDSAAAGAL
jgi:hypothetical protein